MGDSWPQGSSGRCLGDKIGVDSMSLWVYCDDGFVRDGRGQVHMGNVGLVAITGDEQ